MTRTHARRQLLVVALVALIALALLGLWASTSTQAAWESGLLAALALGPDAWGDLVRAVNTLGRPLPWAVFVIVIAALMWRFRGRAAAALVALTLASDLAAWFALTAAWIAPLGAEDAAGETDSEPVA